MARKTPRPSRIILQNRGVFSVDFISNSNFPLITMRRKDIRETGPWVLVNSSDNSIIEEGLFCDLVGKSGNLMTKEFYHQLLDEIN